MLIGDLDHLLIGRLALRIGDRHTHQTTKLTYAVINMHHKVANLKLLNLLQRERHLTTAGLIALEVVFMETVEDLVIGKEADAEVIVGKAFVKRFFYRCEDNIPSHFGKDILQAFVLFLTVGEDIDLIALQQIVLERLGEQVEVLMEEGLHGDMKLQGREVGC